MGLRVFGFKVVRFGVQSLSIEVKGLNFRFLWTLETWGCGAQGCNWVWELLGKVSPGFAALRCRV